MMKKFCFFALFVLCLGGITFAQDRPRSPGPWTTPRNNERSLPDPATVSGTLQLRNGMIALETADTVYYVPLLERFVGFIEGLKEGATVELEGYTLGNSDFFQPVKVTLNGKTYDFPLPAPRHMDMFNLRHDQLPGPGPGFGPGPGGRRHRR
jgi:hypothetical protein